MKKLPESAMTLAEHAQVGWVVTPELGTSYEDVLQPIYWAHVARNLKQWHEISVRAADGSWLARLLVVAAGPQWAKVVELQKWSLDRSLPVDAAATAVAKAEYEVVWRGAAKWSVKRLVDKVIMVQGLDDKGDAERYLEKLATQISVSPPKPAEPAKVPEPVAA